LQTGLPDGFFKPKIPILVNFGGSCNGRFCYILRPFGKSSGHLVNFKHFGIFCGHLEYFPRFGIMYHEKSVNPDCKQRDHSALEKIDLNCQNA
jgi:hypothetical protein